MISILTPPVICNVRGTDNMANFLVKVLNAPITIWLLSAIALGVGGSVFTNTQQCRTDAERAIERHHRLADEIAYRFDVLYDAIRRARSIKELQSSPIVRRWRDQYNYA